MPWNTLANALQTSRLDPETKLVAIDLLSRINDQTLVEDLVELLTGWAAEEKKEDALFLEQVMALEKRFRERQNQVQQQAVKEEQHLEQEMKREEEIEKIRNQIINV
ncbi:MAG: hypothetical protein UU48_C0010G0020 [Candidatus Uhrbacteria bacterium GW2011_GWF2_41_16]|uniref:Uncharacterized protein n=2 Tax=Candidatus Uhriibacteriota TaxID=1752732 RepID=A0A0G0VDH2_9BACT|nr:MAG: hypothetical protein UU35_C0008G0015 [Candidatus Uhrbacteria bacterium GW2011_GWC2_41_11]KKR97696.1 MAG: hypothetical protein UU48_C0010G0020 [Candidatus Uhrbacteria bacterium GW2011_GWF2_41_16]HBO99716.1 hypothetical protein [Candidatus Uhrbacteria bacterium]